MLPALVTAYFVLAEPCVVEGRITTTSSSTTTRPRPKPPAPPDDPKPAAEGPAVSKGEAAQATAAVT